VIIDQRRSVGCGQALGVPAEDFEEELLGEEGGGDVDGVLVVGEIRGGGAGGDAFWSVFVVGMSSVNAVRG